MPTLKSYICIKCGANKEYGKTSCDDCFRKHKDLTQIRDNKFIHRLNKDNINDTDIINIFTNCKVNLNVVMLTKTLINYKQIFSEFIKELINSMNNIHNDEFFLLSQNNIENRYTIIEDKIDDFIMPKSSYIPRHMVSKVNINYKRQVRKIFLINALKIRNLELREDSVVCSDYINNGCDEYTSCAVCVDKMFEMKFMFKQTSYAKIMKRLMREEREYRYIDSDTRILISDQAKDEAMSDWSIMKTSDFDVTSIKIDNVNIWPKSLLYERFKYVKSKEYLENTDY